MKSAGSGRRNTRQMGQRSISKTLTVSEAVEFREVKESVNLHGASRGRSQEKTRTQAWHGPLEHLGKRERRDVSRRSKRRGKVGGEREGVCKDFG